MKTEYDYLAAPLAALRAGNTALAIRQLEELRDVKPDLIEATYHLARAWQAAGDDGKAEACYAEILANSKHPFFAHARVRMAEMGKDPDAPRNGGIVPEAIAEATGSEVPADEAPAQVEAAPAEPAADAPAQVEATPAEAPKGKGKKGKAAASAEGAGGEGASS